MSELRTNKILNTASGTSVKVDRTSSDGDIVELQKDGTTIGSIQASGTNMVIGNNGDVCLNFVDGVTDRIQPANTDRTSRDNAIDLGVAAARFKDLYLGGNIYLGGTGSANALDDYETGTWTPVLADATSGGNTATMGTATGSYTKIGRLVTLSVLCLDINTSGMTAGNVLTLRGLPFPMNADNDAGRHRGAVLVDNINFTNYIMAESAPSNSHMKFADIVDSSGDVELLVSSILSSSSDMRFTFTYFSA